MNNKIIRETNKYLKELQAIVLERIEQAREELTYNEEYSSLLKQRRLNTLALSRALSNNENYNEFEEKEEFLKQKIQNFENKYLNIDNFYFCNKCKDTGYVNGKYCECFMRIYKQLLHNKSGINSLPIFRFEDNTVQNINCKQSNSLSILYNSMQRYCNVFPNNNLKNILLCGKVGIGKSCLLSAILNELLSKGIDAQYLTSYQLNSLLIKYHTTDLRERDVIMEGLIETDVLIIDDLGTEPILKNVTIEYLTILLNERINKHTIIATNLNLAELQDKYGDRVFSRITNKEKTRIIYVDGDDLRHIIR